MACGSCRLNFMDGAQNSAWLARTESLANLVGNHLAD